MRKKVFISCSSNSISRIKILMDRLDEDEVEVICQQTGFHDNSQSYVEQNIKDSSYHNILVVCDKNYKEAIDADNTNESILSRELYEKLEQKSKIILIVYNNESVPDFLSSEKVLDFTDFAVGYRKLLFIIFHEEFSYSQNVDETKLSELALIEYKGYLDVDIDKSSLILGENDIGRLKLVFSNITNNKITSVKVENTDQLVSDLRNTTWLRDKGDPKHSGVVITKYEACSYDYLELLNGNSFTCNIQFKRHNQTFCMICLKVTNKTIYGLKTVQLFTIITVGRTIFPAHVESIS